MQTSSSSNGPSTPTTKAQSVLVPQKVIHKAAKYKKLRRRRLNLYCDCIVYQHPNCLDHGFSHRGINYVGPSEFRRVCLGVEERKETPIRPTPSPQPTRFSSCQNLAESLPERTSPNPQSGDSISTWDDDWVFWDAIFNMDPEQPQPKD
uniref:Transcriptional activator protein n=1 Tax=Begomovirus spathoglottis 1 TaxID=3064730 RepID=A0AA49K7M5_9GEMI|nr:AL2 [Begomovirus spathoglottis 1]